MTENNQENNQENYQEHSHENQPNQEKLSFGSACQETAKIFGLKGKNAKKIIPLLLALILGLIFMGFAQSMSKAEKSTANMDVDPGLAEEQAVAANGEAYESSPALDGLASSEKALELKVAGILGKIQGVGQVQVSLTFAQGVKTEYAVNASTTLRSTQEEDGNGGVKVITEETQSDELVLESNSSKPVAVQEIMPEIQGVLVVAQGADKPAVCAMIAQGVESLLGVPAHKIVICPGERGN